MVALEEGAFGEGEGGGEAEVVGEGGDFGLAGGGEVALELEDDEWGGLAGVEFFLFGGEGFFGAGAGFAGGGDFFPAGVEGGGGVLDFDQGVFFEAAEFEAGAFGVGKGLPVGARGGAVAEGEGEGKARGPVGFVGGGELGDGP